MRKGEAILSMLALATIAMGSENMGYSPNTGESQGGVDPNDLKMFKRSAPIPNGCSEYEFEDGFKCVASNARNANRKHDNHLKQTKL